MIADSLGWSLPRERGKVGSTLVGVLCFGVGLRWCDSGGSIRQKDTMQYGERACGLSIGSSSSDAATSLTSSSQDSSRKKTTQRPVKRTKQERSLARGNSLRDLEAKEVTDWHEEICKICQIGGIR